MSLPVEHPSQPHLNYMGILALGACGLGYNSSGRVQRIHTTWTTDALRYDYSVSSHANLYVNKSRWTDGGSQVVSLTKNNTLSRMTVDLIPLPPEETWNGYLGPLSDCYDKSLRLTWGIDQSTDKIKIFHTKNADKTSTRCIATYQGNTEISVSRMSGLGDITVTGIDGDEAPGGTYLIEVAYGSLTSILVKVFDSIQGIYTTVAYWADEPITIARGLQLSLETPWGGTIGQSTTFMVQTFLKYSYTMENPTSGTHYFKVRAERFEDKQTADSAWVSHTVATQPDPVRNVTVLKDGGMYVQFKTPSTAISGVRVYMSKQSITDIDVPHWHPFATGTGYSANTTYRIPIVLATAGTYYFNVRCYDSTGVDCESGTIHALVVSADDIVLAGELNPPISIKCESLGGGNISVVVVTDRSEDAIKLYYGTSPTTIDWDTPTGTYLPTGAHPEGEDVEGTTYRIYTMALSGYNDMTHYIGVRSWIGSVSDGNVVVYDDVTTYFNPLVAPSSMTLTEV